MINISNVDFDLISLIFILKAKFSSKIFNSAALAIRSCQMHKTRLPTRYII